MSQEQASLPPGCPAGFDASQSLALPPCSDPRREAFVQEMLAGEEVNRAYEAAGFKRARGNAHRMLREPMVAARLAAEFKRVADMDDALINWRRLEHRRALTHLATADRTGLFEEKTRYVLDGRKRRRIRTLELKPLAKLNEDERALIDGIEITDKGGIKVLMPKRLDARALLAKLDGLDKPTKIAPTDPSGDHPAQYIISERPMSAEEWEEQRAGAA